MDMGLKGRTVIVTGASSSIGRGILLGFAAEGAQVVAAQRDEEAGGRAVAEANRLGGEAICVRTDVTDNASVLAMVQATLDRFGKIDVLVNNAGGIPGEAKFIDKSREDWEKEIQLNYCEGSGPDRGGGSAPIVIHFLTCASRGTRGRPPPISGSTASRSVKRPRPSTTNWAPITQIVFMRIASS